MKNYFTDKLIQNTKTKPCCIIQASPMHTASTFLTNVLYGLINKLYNQPVQESGKYHGPSDILVVKCHHINIDDLISYYGKYYELYFVCSERRDKQLLMEPKYKKYKNVVVFDFDELNETPSLSLNTIVKNVATKVKAMVPGTWGWSESHAIQRIRNMNKRYAEIKERPFTYQDPFFLIHGHHINRPDASIPTNTQTRTEDTTTNPTCNLEDSVLHTEIVVDVYADFHATLQDVDAPLDAILQDGFVETGTSMDISPLS